MPGALSKYRAITPIGAVMRHPDLAPLLTLADGSKWLRAGVFASPASYPLAATLTHLRGLSLTRIAHTFGAVSTSAASNGSGVILATNASAGTTIDRSADGGVTWGTAFVPVNPAETVGPSRVYYLNGKFWAIGNDATGLWAAESVTGATGTWTKRTIIASVGGTTTANTAAMDWTGTNYVAVCSTNSAANSIHTSTDGVTWTPRAVSSGTAQPVAVASAATGGTVVFSRGATYNVSTDHGVTWGAALTAPATIQQSSLFAIGSRFFADGGTLGLSSTTTPATTSSWASVSVPLARLSLLSASQATLTSGFRSADRQAFYCAVISSVGVSGLLKFKTDGTSEFLPWDRNNFSSAAGALVAEAGRVVLLNSTVNSSRASADFETPNAVCVGYETGAVGATVPETTYVRVA